MRTRIAMALTVVVAAALTGACTRPAGGGPKTLTVTPVCTIYCTVRQDQVAAWNSQVFVADRGTSSDTFTPFRRFRGPGINVSSLAPAATGIPNTYSMAEAWAPFLGPNVFRAFTTPAMRKDGSDFLGASWEIDVQDPTGAWTRLHSDSPDVKSDYDDPDMATAMTPTFMPVGQGQGEMFACVNQLTLDLKGRTTWLVKLTPPTSTAKASITFVQDVLYGDTHWDERVDVLNPHDPNAAPPTPAVVNPPSDLTDRLGTTLCAMTQVGDDLSTRQLNMFNIYHGHLYHSAASGWGTATDFRGQTFMRFATQTQWTDVNRAFPIDDPVVDVAAVGGPSLMDVFIATRSGNTTNIMHTARRQADGVWRAPIDVLTVDSAFPVRVAAGWCPKVGVTDGTSEIMMVAYDIARMRAVRVTRTSSETTYASAGDIPIPTSDNLPSPPPFPRLFLVRHVTVGARPFPDNATT